MSPIVAVIKTVKMKLENIQIECTLTRAAIVDNPTTEELQTFCGTETTSLSNYSLELAGFADWGQAQSFCDMIHAAYVADPIGELDYQLTVGTRRKSGTCKPTNDPVFGGDAGGAMTTDTITLDIIGTPVDSVVVKSTSATAGAPGTWNPADSAQPESVPALKNAAPAITASPTSAWSAGQYVQTGTPGATGEAHWTGSAWATGRG